MPSPWTWAVHDYLKHQKWCSVTCRLDCKSVMHVYSALLRLSLGTPLLCWEETQISPHKDNMSWGHMHVPWPIASLQSLPQPGTCQTCEGRSPRRWYQYVHLPSWGSIHHRTLKSILSKPNLNTLQNQWAKLNGCSTSPSFGVVCYEARVTETSVSQWTESQMWMRTQRDTQARCHMHWEEGAPSHRT